MKNHSIFFSLILAVICIFSFSENAFAAEIQNPSYTFNTISGETISNSGIGKKATLIVFGRDICINTSNTLNNIAKSNWVSSDDIRIIFADIDNNSQDEIIEFANEIGSDKITYCYDTSKGTNDLLRGYLRSFNYYSSVTLPVIVFIDGNNNCREVMTGTQDASTIIEKIQSFADIDYVETDIKVSVSVTGYSNYDYAKTVIELTNRERSKKGLPLLKMDSDLMQIAMQRAAELAVYYSHTRPDGTSCFTASDRRIVYSSAENIAMCQITPEEVTTSWINSPGHYSNMINESLTTIGVGCFRDKNGTYYWVQFFDSGYADSSSLSGNIETTYTIQARTSKLSLFTDNDVYFKGSDTKVVNMNIYNTNQGFNWYYTNLNPTNFIFTSSDTNVATVNDYGVVTMTGFGTATITATLKGNSRISVSQNFTMEKDKLDTPVVTATPKPTATPAPEKLSAPSAKIANVASTGKPKISWNAVSGATKYEVWVSTSKNGTYKFLTTTPKTVITHTGAVAGGSYYYKIKAIHTNTNLNSVFSNVVSKVCDLPAPSAKIASVASTGKLKISWKAVSGATKYEVYMATSKTGEYKYLGKTSNTSITHTGAVAGGSYYYKVKAIHANANANSAFSSVVSKVCDLPAPTAKIATVLSSGKLQVSWKAVPGAEKYEVWVSTSKNGTYRKLKTTEKTVITHTGAVAGGSYYYKVKAIHANANANSAFGNVVSRVCDLARPELTVSLSSKGKPVLKWKAVPNAEKYEVYRATSKNGKYKHISTTTKTTVTHTGATAGTTYYYKVRAIHTNTNANSAYSTVKNIKSR